MQCPCHSKKPYKMCCKPLHDGDPAKNAKHLMRSRYAAYALNLPNYIINTTHRDNPAYLENKEQWKSELVSFSKQTEYVSLDILTFVEKKELAFVTFRAGLIQKGRDISFTEKSRFLKENGKWFYVDGVFES